MAMSSNKSTTAAAAAASVVGGPLMNCCQSNDSLTSSTSTTDQQQEDNICEAMNNFVINKRGGGGGGRQQQDYATDNLLTHNNNNTLMNSNVKKYFPRREPINVKFENIVYTSKQWKFNRNRIFKETKEILHGVSGEFKSGELSVIMGPSGAGKSTLLNGLAGYIAKGFTGHIKYNDEIRTDGPRYRKMVAYIFQDEELRVHLTVMENMLIAADLKLGYGVSPAYKLEQVEELLKMLGLERCKNTLTGRLSGGQRKRLAIALELLSNPPILFLDEPTTGLDSLSCSQCIALLKKLAHEGRTVICTIHQPSALLFEMFDHLYVLANGICIYDGDVPQLLPQLKQLGLECPPFHNPADFLMDVAIGEYGTDIAALADLEHKKQLAARSKTIEEQRIEKKEKLSKNMSNDEMTVAPPPPSHSYSTSKPANSLMQFLLLYKRNLMIAKRQYKAYMNRIIAHIVIGIVFGYLYRGVGEYAHTFLANYIYYYGTMLLVVYTGQMSVTLSFPLELNIVSREYFNRWYKLPPYLISILLVEIPFQVFCSCIYIAITYPVTGQLFDYRLYFFILFCCLGTLCAQSWGYFIGSVSPSSSVAVFISPVLACLFSVFGFTMSYDDTPYMFRWLYHFSYFRASFQGLTYAMNGLPRAPLPCDEDLIYCHYADPMKFIRDMGIEGINLWMNVTVIVVITFCMHTTTFISIWYKLTKR